jgi:branched-chain amino acid transport system ATP-binding protein
MPREIIQKSSKHISVEMTEPLLTIDQLSVSYGPVPAVNDVSMTIEAGGVTVILGANGAGKSTILKTVIGLLRPRNGSIRFDGKEIRGLPPHKIHGLGIAWVPEGRQVWASLSVIDNLRTVVSDEGSDAIEVMLDRFPRLRERKTQLAGSLSGGEQQMLALARAMVSSPKLILMDEPSLGLAPLVVRDVFNMIREIQESGITVLLVEQNARQALRLASHAYLLQVGRLVMDGHPDVLSASGQVQEAFLGGVSA